MAPAILPHTLRNSNTSARLILEGQGVGSYDCLGTLDLVPRDPRHLAVRPGRYAGRHVHDEPALAYRVNGTNTSTNPVRLEDPQFGRPVLSDVLQVAADPELAPPEPLPPLEQVAPRARGLDAQLLQLLRRQGEERLPRRELRRVLAEPAPDHGQERLYVRDEGRGRGDDVVGLLGRFSGCGGGG